VTADGKRTDSRRLTDDGRQEKETIADGRVWTAKEATVDRRPQIKMITTGLNVALCRTGGERAKVMKVRELLGYRWLRDWLVKLRTKYLNWRVRRAW